MLRGNRMMKRASATRQFFPHFVRCACMQFGPSALLLLLLPTLAVCAKLCTADTVSWHFSSHSSDDSTLLLLLCGPRRAVHPLLEHGRWTLHSDRLWRREPDVPLSPPAFMPSKMARGCWHLSFAVPAGRLGWHKISVNAPECQLVGPRIQLARDRCLSHRVKQAASVIGRARECAGEACRRLKSAVVSAIEPHKLGVREKVKTVLQSLRKRLAAFLRAFQAKWRAMEQYEPLMPIADTTDNDSETLEHVVVETEEVAVVPGEQDVGPVEAAPEFPIDAETAPNGRINVEPVTVKNSEISPMTANDNVGPEETLEWISAPVAHHTTIQSSPDEAARALEVLTNQDDVDPQFPPAVISTLSSSIKTHREFAPENSNSVKQLSLSRLSIPRKASLLSQAIASSLPASASSASFISHSLSKTGSTADPSTVDDEFDEHILLTPTHSESAKLRSFLGRPREKSASNGDGRAQSNHDDRHDEIYRQANRLKPLPPPKLPDKWLWRNMPTPHENRWTAGQEGTFTICSAEIDERGLEAWTWVIVKDRQYKTQTIALERQPHFEAIDDACWNMTLLAPQQLPTYSWYRLQVQDNQDHKLLSPSFFIYAASAPQTSFKTMPIQSLQALFLQYPHDRRVKQAMAQRYLQQYQRHALQQLVRDGYYDEEIERQIWLALSQRK